MHPQYEGAHQVRVIDTARRTQHDAPFVEAAPHVGQEVQVLSELSLSRVPRTSPHGMACRAQQRRRKHAPMVLHNHRRLSVDSWTVV